MKRADRAVRFAIRRLVFAAAIATAHPLLAQQETTDINHDLVFMSARSGEGDLYWFPALRPSEASAPELYQGSEAPDYNPRRLGPDGGVLFLSERNGSPELFRASGPSAEARSVGPSPGFEAGPDVSADGEWIAYSDRRDGNLDVFVSRLDGSDERRITDHPGADVQPRWSPDGRRIAFASDRDGDSDIYVLELSSGEIHRLTENDRTDGHPGWSPDGRYVLFDSTDTEEGSADIFTLHIESLTRVNVTRSPGDDLVADWSPDGKWIAFGSSRSGDWEIYLVRPDGSNTVRLTHDPGFDGDPKWLASPGKDPR